MRPAAKRYAYAAIGRCRRPPRTSYRPSTRLAGHHRCGGRRRAEGRRGRAAIVNFTKSLSLDLIQRGIRVNSVAPGPVWTPLIPATLPPEKVEQFGANTPLGRPAQPAELAPIYVFLASEESRYITGDVLGVTGGRRIS